MITDYDDDTHFCIKCHATILGLENYVSHRKSNCGKSIHVEELPKSPLPSQLLPPDESFSLKADDFFSSLELQSSSKKIASHSTTGKNLSRILTRSKASAVIQANNANKDVDIQPSKSGKNAWIGGHQLKELGTGDNQTKLIKAVDNLTRSTALKKVEESNLHTYEDTDDDSDDYYYDDESDLEDQQSGPPRSHTGGKWKPSSSPVQWSVNREWNPPPINFTGGKWKPSRRISPPPNQNKEFISGKWIPSKCSPKRDDQNKDDDRDWNSPPISFTGGKWKPCKRNSPPPSHTKGKWKPESPSYDTPKPSFTGGKWTSSKSKIDEQIKDDESKWGDYVTAYDYPPPGHTKGKWKPSGLQEIHKKGHVEAPPPTHTEGKWLPTDKHTKSDTATASTSYSIIATDLPPFRKSNGRVQYWCGPCNRRLASKIVYERHLRSDLHMKRTRRNSDEFDDSSHLNTNNATESKKNKKPVEYWSNTDTANNEDTMKNAESRSKRIRSRTFIKCQVCRSRVHKHLMGKHLISHYHCRKGDITIPTAREMVLENIYSIVLQSPYQCATCRFYCNTQDDFLTHWCSAEHITKVERYQGLFWCSFCKHEASLTSKMLDHLLSEEHNEVISAINRSVPIVIRKINPTKCETCNATFLLNIQLRKHCEHEGHPFSNTSSNIYQNKHFCDMCAEVFKSRIALQRHKKTKHGRHEYMCSVCGMNFETLLEAKMHRQTKEHRYANEARMGKMVPEKKVTKECQHCKRKFERMALLKQHLKIDHPEHKHSCPRCGITFIIPQELSVHLRTKSCNFNQTPEKQNKCDRCPYSTESESELLFHIVLHGEPLIFADDKCKKGSRPVEKYKCPFCQKFFAKLSLRCHIRLHTKERPYVCTGCGASFVRKNNWALHTKNCGREKTNQKKQATGRDIAGSSYLCSTCGASFKKKSILQLHMTRHTGKLFKCPTEGCIFSARTHAELQPHLITHSDLKPFACTECDYKGKTKKQLVRHLTAHAETKKYKCSRCPFTTRLSSHLKRHMRLHTGAKPFSCPHCTYRCNNMENLRKHVLSSNRHPGKCIYECKFCPGSSFGSNFARDFKVHLIAEHPDVFHSGSHAATYITGIYEAAEDPVFVDTASNQEVKSSDNAAKVTDIYQLEFHKHIPITAVSTATTSTQLLNTEDVQECVVESKGGEELFPMYVVAKDEEVVCVENPSDSWNMVGSYDVEESGALVPFNSDGETLFQEHFQ